MNALHLIASAAGLMAALAATAAPADEALDRALVELRQSAGERGAWVNPYMPHGTGQYAAESADRILAATLRVYTREVLDRGGWVNPYMAERHYEAGNALLAVAPGQGVTSRSASAGTTVAYPATETRLVARAEAAEAPDACIDQAGHTRHLAQRERGVTVASALR